MIIACSTTSTLPSDTANAIQAVMACDGLRRCKEGVHLYAPGSGEISFERLKDQYNMRCEPFPVRYLTSRPRLHRLDFCRSLLSEGNKIGAEVHYTWTIQAAVTAALQGHETAYEAHDMPMGQGVRWFRLYTHLRVPKKILCITKALRDKLLARYRWLSKDDCLIMPNGYSPEDYLLLPDLEAAKRLVEFPTDRLAVSCSGHLYAGRGSDLFMRLAERFPEADFHWFGGTPEATKRCRDEASAAGIHNVTFHGSISRSDLPMVQAACDVLLMPYAKHIAGSGGGNSAEICSPMKMFEYMAEGRCILSSDLPVIHEVLDKNCAVFCEPEDLDSWTAGLRAVLEGRSLRENLAAEAKRRSEAYTWEKRAKIYLDNRIVHQETIVSDN